MVLASVSATARLPPGRSLAAADSIIPPGACVVTDTASATIAVNRFNARSPGCPQRIAWTWSLYGYFDRHFRLLHFASSFRGKGDIPRGGLYGRA
jgi:hypothetical protein